VQGKGGALASHVHPLSLISMVLYVNVDKDSNPLYFYNPNPYLEFTEFTSDTKYGHSWYRFKPEMGEMILFPSWLKHGSDKELNQTDNRIIIGINAN
jgi:hypothetical protein